MEQEFITSSGKVIINNKRLLIQNLKFNFWETVVGEMMVPVFILSFAILSFFNNAKPFSLFAAIIFIALFFSTSFKQLYAVLVQKSYAGYIPINRVKSFELKPDEFGLETEVLLHLKNHRYRSIKFRTLEKQYEPFVEQLSQYLVPPQFA